jgi:hypothetical protein
METRLRCGGRKDRGKKRFVERVRLDNGVVKEEQRMGE